MVEFARERATFVNNEISKKRLLVLDLWLNPGINEKVLVFFLFNNSFLHRTIINNQLNYG
ncbi:MAG: hypothetical protein JG782_1034 [Anaerophaga sp.]|nr:hypothetical protein [Anaerophaga sp.]MDI3520940.1 hypothetical protein [Anaerophaga sp.]MDK2841016.1 hypothetical protein [Anaerophaga sp.]MDN5290384.1 hypothetical protein [Anaerophaga sp.]